MKPIRVCAGCALIRLLQGNPDCVGDQIPVDMVGNVILASPLRLAAAPGRLHIFHSSSSTRNPITWGFAR